MNYLLSSCVLISVQFMTLHCYAASAEINRLAIAKPCEQVQPESQILKHVHLALQQRPQQKKQILEKFWAQVAAQQTPIIEDFDASHQRMIYLWRGAEHNVRLVGGPSNNHDWLTRLPNTDIWFKEKLVQRDFIGSYSFAVNIPNVDGYLSHHCAHLNLTLQESREQRRALLEVLQIDPYNPHTWLDPKHPTTLRNENWIALDQAPSFIDPRHESDLHAVNIHSYTLSSKILANKRTLQVFQSVNPLKQSYITAIFFDGEYYADLLNVPKALDLLVAQGKLPPIQAVFVSVPDAVQRSQELTPNPKFSAFFSNELLPWIDQKLKRDPNKTVLLGSSLGGLSSAYLALEHPQQISHVVPLSGSFWWKKNPTDTVNSLSKMIREQSNQPIQQWFITANSYEGSRTTNQLSILETSPIVAEDLKMKGHKVMFKQYTGGHSYAVWQVALQDALIHFFASQ